MPYTKYDKKMKKIILPTSLIIAMLLSIIITKTLLSTSKQISLAQTSADSTQMKQDTTSQYLADAVKFKTISTKNKHFDHQEEFNNFNRHLEKTFPKTHNTLTRKRIGQNSLLFIWRGTKTQTAPVLFITHSDVVPAESGHTWSFPPFSGKISDGYIWGRGTLDNKINVVAQLLAIETLIADGFQPARTLLFAIGADEETGGENGARKIAEYLNSHNLNPGVILDEGGVITKNIIPSINRPVALIGIAEKGYLTLSLQVSQTGGHASMPPRHTAIGRLSSALHKLEASPLPTKITSPIRQMFDYLGPEMGRWKKALIANLWLFQPLVKHQLSLSPSTNASIQSTMAITQINGGIAENILPPSASATVNIRLLPGDTVESVTNHVRQAIQDPGIIISVSSGSYEASPVSDPDTKFFRLIQKTIHQLYPNALVAPYLTVSASDSRHFVKMGRNIYRFSPLQLDNNDLKRIHGKDERISEVNFNNAVNFYQQLFINLRNL